MSLHRAIECARRAREEGTADRDAAPAKLHELASGDVSIYRHAMTEAGHIVIPDTGEPFAVCPHCGYEFRDTGQLTLG